MQDLVYWSMVQKIWGVKGNKTLPDLLGKIKGYEFWELTEKDMSKNFPIISQEMVTGFILGRKKIKYREEYERINKLGIKIISIIDNRYPKRLKNLFYPPPLLYVRGNLEEKKLALAVVGARRASLYGKKVAQNLALQLSNNGIQIISGLARGIDACGHSGALMGTGGTIAALGSGVDVVYPRENTSLYHKIINSGRGAVVSEFPLGTQPLRHHFPIRNRIISGLSDGVLVIEAGEKSGSLITAEFALEQGKEVFAVPGPMGNPLYKGSHRLIKDGAKLVDDIEDILEEFGQMCLFKNEQQSLEMKVNETEKRVLGTLGLEPVSIDEIAVNTKLSIKTIISILSVLEIKGLVKQIAGRKFISLN